MKIKNGQIEFFSNWLLNNLQLAGKKNRMRMKFIGILAIKAEEFRKYHLQLLQEHCHLDEQGNPKVIQLENERGQYDVIDQVAFEHDFMELLSEEITIEENDENKMMLVSLKESIEECPKEWSGEEAIEYEQICQRFDDIYAEQA